MKLTDMLLFCLQNLTRRKSRTLLTVLGVVIGSCAIIIMVSIGIGSKESQEIMLSQMGDLTVIEIYSYGEGRNDSATKLDDNSLDSIKAFDDVLVATPIMNFPVSTKTYAGKTKRYVCQWGNYIGMSDNAPELLEYELLSGEYPDEPYEILVGQYFAYNFFDSKRPDGYNMVDRYSGGFDENYQPINVPDPYFDIMLEPITLEVDTGDGKKPVSVKLKVVGILKEDYGKGWETSEGVILRLDDMHRILKDYRKISGDKSVPSTSFTYTNAKVKASSISAVATVESNIKSLGFDTWSMESIREPMEKEARQRQLMLFGLGAISLFVAAIGITNTMIMSISERTREIGVMKSLGCYLSDIRKMFLLEAGCIGLIGGIVGIIVSLIISVIMNIATSQMPITDLQTLFMVLTQKGSRTSVIPVWLLGFSLIFSLLIGIGSGYHPANKAVKVSALEAIRHE